MTHPQDAADARRIAGLLETAADPAAQAAAGKIYATLAVAEAHRVAGPTGDDGVPQLTIPDRAWKPCGGPGPGDEDSYARAEVRINGVPVIVEAVEVTAPGSASEGQCAVQSPARLATLSAHREAGAAFQTVQIWGRHYVLIALPADAED